MAKQISSLFESGRTATPPPFPPHPDLGDIIVRAMWLSRLNELFLGVLTQELAAHCRLLNLREGRLAVAADSSIWATKLRLKVPELLDALAKLPDFPPVEEIQCCVQMLE